MLIDDGAEACPQCGAVDAGLYCRQCGTHKAEEIERHSCKQCHMYGSGPYCVHCGAVLLDPVEEELEAGTFNWRQWHESLQPFLGGLTTKERELLARNP